MSINAASLRHWIDNFYGYGRWEAPIWFISHEDGGGDLPEEVSEKLDYFQSTHQSSAAPTLCDIREVYKHSTYRYEGPNPANYLNLFDFRFGSRAKVNGVWRNLIAFVHAYHGKPGSDALEYQKKSFASHDVALIKLLPLPSPNSHAWYYSWLDMPEFPFLKSRMRYEEHLYPTRIKKLLENIVRHKPELVLMYGMGAINLIKKLVTDLSPQVKFNMVKSVKLRTPQHHRAEINGTMLLLTTQIPALRHNRAETGFDWYEFGKSLRGWRI